MERISLETNNSLAHIAAEQAKRDTIAAELTAQQAVIAAEDAAARRILGMSRDHQALSRPSEFKLYF